MNRFRAWLSGLNRMHCATISFLLFALAAVDHRLGFGCGSRYRLFTNTCLPALSDATAAGLWTSFGVQTSTTSISSSFSISL